MKKIKVLALGASVVVGALATSCGGGTVSTSVALKNTADSIAYAYGAAVYQQMVTPQLSQAGVLGDTMMVSMEYSRKLDEAADEAAKSVLLKEKRRKIDSIQSANKVNLAAFYQGFKEGMNAKEGQAAHIQGLGMGSQMGSQSLTGLAEHLYGSADKKDKISKDLFLAAFTAAMKNEKLLIENPEVRLNSFIETERAGYMEQLHSEAKVAGEKFLADNKTQAGVTTLPSGVQYKVLTEGKGNKPTASDMVKVHYHGTLIDGTVFDSSVERKEPATFGVGQVIPGWTEILQLMPVGSKWQVYIPYDQAYGTADMGNIKPYSTLVFDVELLGIEK